MSLEEKKQILEKAVGLGLRRFRKPLLLINSGQAKGISPITWYSMLSLIKYYISVKYKCIIETNWVDINTQNNTTDLRWQVSVDILKGERMTDECDYEMFYSEFKALEAGVKAAFKMLDDA